MMLTAEQMLFLANFFAAAVVAYVCLCRLNALTARSKLTVRMKYTVIMTAACTMAGMPILFDVRHTFMTLTGVVLVLVLLVFEMRHWRRGPPINTWKRDFQ